MVSLSETHIENRERVLPNHANNYETLHGGILMKWMDEVGAMSAMRFAGETCVTAAVDEFSFDRPVPVGQTAVIEAYAYSAGRTSVRISLRADREEPRTGDRETTTTAHFTFVAVDEDGRPTDVPELEVGTEEEQALRDLALAGDAGDPDD